LITLIKQIMRIMVQTVVGFGGHVTTFLNWLDERLI